MIEKQKYPLRGIIVSLNTPFTEDDRIDFASLERLVEHHLREGVAGFLVPAQAAEIPELRFEERIALVRRVRECTMGRSKLIAGATSSSLEESLATAKQASAIGCDGVLAELPDPLKNDPAGAYRFCRDLSKAGTPMLMIQDLDWRGRGMDVSLIVDLFEKIPAFRCLKVEVAPAGPKYTEVINATAGRLHVSGGWAADQMIEALDRGVDAFIPTGMTRLYRLIFEAHQRGDLERARQLFYKILPVLAFTRQHIDVSIHFYKRFFKEAGIFSTARVRRNRVPFDSYHETQAEWLIRYLRDLETEQT